MFQDPSWSQGQNCWDELGLPCVEQTSLRGGAKSSSNQFHRGDVRIHVDCHAPGRRESTSYFFLVVFFAVFLAVVFFAAAFFIAIVINHLLYLSANLKGAPERVNEFILVVFALFASQSGLQVVGWWLGVVCRQLKVIFPTHDPQPATLDKHFHLYSQNVRIRRRHCVG